MRFQTETAVKIRDAFAARHEPEAARVLGEWFWTLLVILLILVTIGSIIFGTREFLKPLTQEVEESVSVGQRKGVTRAELVKILELFDARAKEYELRRTAPVPVRDPS
jgi:hypothetical protein